MYFNLGNPYSFKLKLKKIVAHQRKTPVMRPYSSKTNEFVSTTNEKHRHHQYLLDGHMDSVKKRLLFACYK